MPTEGHGYLSWIARNKRTKAGPVAKGIIVIHGTRVRLEARKKDDKGHFLTLTAKDDTNQAQTELGGMDPA